jgi:group I intron endonuclease
MIKEKLCGIYLIYNIENAKVYIGKANDIKNRWRKHREKLIGNYHENKYLQNSWNKYWEKSFEWFVIEINDKNNLSERERYFIKLYNSNNSRYGYNLTGGGDEIGRAHV